MIALLSNITIETLSIEVSKITGEEVYTAPGYNTWVQEIIGAEFVEQKPSAVFIILDGLQLLGDTLPSNIDEARTIIAGYFEPIKLFVQHHPEIPTFVSSLDIPQNKISPLVSSRIEYKVESYWRSELEEERIPIIELAEIARNIGRSKFYSPRMWYLGSIPFSMAGGKAIAQEIGRAFNALKGIRKKCLVLDLDNTLWGGVIGEDGVNGIELSALKEGARFRDFQKGIKDLKNEGVILAIVSKNNKEDVHDAIRKHPDMILRESDFVAILANWDPKPLNIEKLAVELNIGLDSFVFIDDNPVERETVKILLPDVTVPEFPKDTSTLWQFISDISTKYFPLLKLTGEDIKKTDQYRTEYKRAELKKTSSSLEDYLESLNMKLTVREIKEDDIARSAQLTQKTNQFNLTARRYTEGDIRRMSDSKEYKIWIGELEDRFGSYGKVILAIAKLEGSGTANIDTFLMSCRVMGRNVEKNFLDFVESSLAAEGISKIIGKYIDTQKNTVVKDFWTKMGYTCIYDNDVEKFYNKEYVI